MDQLSSAPVARGEWDRPWKRIASEMRAKIADGRWRPGERLPTIAVLQVEHAGPDRDRVAKNTVRNALDQLRTEGLIVMDGRSLYVRREEQQ